MMMLIQVLVFLFDDGLIELEVIEKADGNIRTKVLNSGTVKNKKGVNVPNVSIKLPGITEKDVQDIVFGIEQGVDFIAASFVRKASDVLEIRELLEEHNAQITSKSSRKSKTKKVSITSMQS